MVVKTGGAAIFEQLSHGGQGGKIHRIPVKTLPYFIERFEPVKQFHALHLREASGKILIQMVVGVNKTGI